MEEFGTLDARLGRALMNLDTVAALKVALVVAGAGRELSAVFVMEHPAVRTAASTDADFLHAVAHAVECGAITAWMPEARGQVGLFAGYGPTAQSVSLDVLMLATGEQWSGMVRVYAEAVRDSAINLVSNGADDKPFDENIYQLHERVIGPFGHSRQQQLALLEEDYPASWIHRAFEIAGERDVRNLSYIQGILRSWRERGPDQGVGDPGPDDRGGYVDELVATSFPWER